MRPRALVRLGLGGLALLLVVLCGACDDEDEDGLMAEGSQLKIEAAPNPVHLYIDSSGSSDVVVTLTDLFGTPLAGETVDLETMDGTFTSSGTGMDTGVTDAAGMYTTTFTSSVTVDAVVSAQAIDLTTFHVIRITNAEPEPSIPSQTHLLGPVTATITDCADMVSLGGLLEDADNLAIQGATVVIGIRPMSAMPTSLTGTFMESGTDTYSVTTGAFGAYPVVTESATFMLDPTECGSCGLNPGDCQISLFATFTGPSGTYESDVDVNDPAVNDLVISTDLP